uniref:CBS domain-containing protein n=1 Tax=Magnetococcus massalia (strain MO-1) TaxID=451514 RepID=A0A1S7LMW1_MAGMO|nr:Protein of unknown function. Containing CBS(cystathionine-beta-synthase) domain [Candidatus Magnetococcus massalia]
MNMLTGAPVSCTLSNMEIMRGHEDIEEVFELAKNVARAVEDGSDAGDSYICFDLGTSIALSGFMMMMGEAVIKEQVKKKINTEEIQEGFQEVANQIVGAFNDLVEERAESGHMLLILPTEHIEYGSFPAGLEDERTYVVVTSDIQVGDFAPEPAKWLFSRGLVRLLTGLEMEGTAEELSLDASKSGGDAAGEDAAAADSSGDSADAAGAADAADSTGDAADAADAASGDAAADGALGDAPGDAPGDASEEALAAEFEDGDLPLIEEDPDGGDDLIIPEETGGDIGFDHAAGSSTASDDNQPDFIRQPMPKHGYSEDDGLPNPELPGSVQQVMGEVPFTLKDSDRVIKAINAMRRDGYKYIGIDRDGKLIRVLSASDIRQLMGPFFGTRALTKRDKVIFTVPLGRLNLKQDLVSITLEGTVSQAADLITQYKLRALPVISKNGVLRGFVTAHNMLDFFRRKRQV